MGRLLSIESLNPDNNLSCLILLQTGHFAKRIFLSKSGIPTKDFCEKSKLVKKRNEIENKYLILIIDNF
jgi:hypothetical protein